MARKKKIDASLNYYGESANDMREEFFKLFENETEEKKEMVQKLIDTVPIPLIDADYIQISILADSLVLYKKIMQKLDEQGLQVVGNNGIKPNDLLTKRSQLVKEITSISSSFGLDVASRHALLASTIEEEESKHDPVLQLLGEIKGA